MRPAFLALLFSLCSPASAQDTDLKGVITDAKGLPISAVDVVGLHHFAAGGNEKVRTKTNELGEYKLSGVGKVMFFRKPGFRPLTKVRSFDEQTVDALMEPTREGSKLPDCTPAEQSEKRRYGGSLLFRVPQGIKVRKEKPGIDAWGVSVTFPGNHKEQMTISSGPLLADALITAPEEWYLDGSVISESESASLAVDIQGEMPGGNRWRMFAGPFDIAEYHDVSERAARSFDQIIASGCRKTFAVN